MDAAVQVAKEKESCPTVEARKDLVESFGWLPCQLSLQIPVVNFTVGDLLRLGKGSIVETDCKYNPTLNHKFGFLDWLWISIRCGRRYLHLISKCVSGFLEALFDADEMSPLSMSLQLMGMSDGYKF